MQPLAQSESDSGVEACWRLGGEEDGVWGGVGWRKEQEGATISEGNDPIPPFCIHRLRHASVLLEAAAGERASGLRGHPPRRSPSGPRVFQPQRGLREAPRRSRSWDLAPPGQARDPRSFSIPAPLDVGAERGVQKPSLKPPPGRRGARGHPGLSGRGCATPAIAF